MKTVAKWSIAYALALTGVCAQTPIMAAAATAGEAQPGIPPVSLAQLAQEADFVGVAQVRDTDYLRRRDIPVSGSAYLRVLITYKSGDMEEIIEVYEKGLRQGECYFPNPSVLEEGRRYLLFLRRDPEHPERYRGLPAGCAIDVLVDGDNRYAVRVPVTGIRLADALAELARPMRFSDPYAAVDDDALPAALRETMQAAGHIEPHVPEGEESTGEAAETASIAAPPGATATARQWLYTQGIPLGEFRRLMDLEANL